MDKREHIRSGGRHLGRRGLFRAVGAGGLAAAATRFGTGTAHAATSCGCCNLAHCPQNTTYTYCQAHSSYIWACDGYPGQGIECYCCETGNDAQSAYKCVTY